jgi:D-alanyl-lipoteichoic acid acyltransferase DltB (MBOAT superfamily)
MVFTTFNFLIFFLLVIVIYYSMPRNFRWLVLLAASYFFYINMKPVFALLLSGVTLSTYLFARLIEGAASEAGKKFFKITNIILILLPLFFFKYFSVINNSLINLLDSYHVRWPLPEIELFLPVGISFYTFMAIGYTLDVYNEEVKAEKNIGILALFISFFPLILSGPIERAKNMIPQFRATNDPDYAAVVSGMKLMLWGYFMKLVVADRLAIYIDAIYLHIPHHNGTTLLLASVLYPFQVYADLGGYSLIAIGVAKILGFTVMQNFRRPFFATSMSELWRRWHISLITWLTDYVYTPLSFAFRKYKIWGIVTALLITFLISGIWHAPTWTYLAWGILQGICLSVEALTVSKRAAFRKRFSLNGKTGYVVISCLLTFLLFSASLVFAKTSSMHDALTVFSKIFSESGSLFIGAPSILLFGLLGIIMLLTKDFTEEFAPSKLLLFENKHKPVRILAYSAVIVIILMIGVFDGGQFIYFQF